jgi:hypothetical protein
MNNLYGSIFLAGIIAASIYKYSDNIKCEISKMNGKNKAKRIAIDFFKTLLKENQYTTIDEAILKFENSKLDNLEDFALSKNRRAEDYRDAYIYMFKKAKEEVYPQKINGFSFNNIFL